MSDGIPLWINATRIEFRASKDRSGFLLTVQSQERPPVEIRFPRSFAPEMLEQVQNLVQALDRPFDANPPRDPKAN